MRDFVHLPLKIYYNPQPIANILSLKAVSEVEGYRVSMDTDEDPSIRLHHGNITLKFPHGVNGLYYCTVEDMNLFSSKVKSVRCSSGKPTKAGKHVSFLQAYTKANAAKTTQVRELQQQMMWPSDEAMKYYLKHDLIKGTDLSSSDIDNVNRILGKPLASVRGKTMGGAMVFPLKATSVSQRKDHSAPHGQE